MKPHLAAPKPPCGEEVTRTALRILSEDRKARLTSGPPRTPPRSARDETENPEKPQHEEKVVHGESNGERWLVSYADMMTLLFGLFAMLYAMANKFPEAQNSISKSFGETEQTPPAPVSPEAPETVVPSLQVALDKLKKENEELHALLKKPDKKSGPKLERIIAGLREELKKTEAKQEAAALRARMALTPKPSSFLAFVMTWSTSEHDVDLKIQDPGGQSYDFKKRRIQGHPGEFVLDSRRGPATELWQAEKIIPGRYTATYVFYNPYTNRQPAKVSARVITTKGSFALPEVELHMDSNNTATVFFDAEADGAIKVQP